MAYTPALPARGLSRRLAHMPSVLHERWKDALLKLLHEKLTPCTHCSLGLRDNPQLHAYNARAHPSQFISWTRRPHGHDHLLDLLGRSRPRSLRTAANTRAGEVLRTGHHRPRRGWRPLGGDRGPARACARARHPALRGARGGALDAQARFRPAEPRVTTAEDRAVREWTDAFNRSQGSEFTHRFAYSSVVDDDGRLASGRYVGSAPGADDRPPLHGHAIQARSCSWSCERAHDTLERQWPGP